MASGDPPLVNVPEVLGDSCQPLALQLSLLAGDLLLPGNLPVKKKSALPFHSLARSSYFCRVFAALGLLRSFGAPSLVDSIEVLSD